LLFAGDMTCFANASNRICPACLADEPSQRLVTAAAAAEPPFSLTDEALSTISSILVSRMPRKWRLDTAQEGSKSTRVYTAGRIVDLACADGKHRFDGCHDLTKVGTAVASDEEASCIPLGSLLRRGGGGRAPVWEHPRECKACGATGRHPQSKCERYISVNSVSESSPSPCPSPGDARQMVSHIILAHPEVTRNPPCV
jgi:hypothetical protein